MFCQVGTPDSSCNLFGVWCLGSGISALHGGDTMQHNTILVLGIWASCLSAGRRPRLPAKSLIFRHPRARDGSQIEARVFIDSL